MLVLVSRLKSECVIPSTFLFSRWDVIQFCQDYPIYSDHTEGEEVAGSGTETQTKCKYHQQQDSQIRWIAWAERSREHGLRHQPLTAHSELKPGNLSKQWIDYFSFYFFSSFIKCWNGISNILQRFFWSVNCMWHTSGASLYPQHNEKSMNELVRHVINLDASKYQK